MGTACYLINKGEFFFCSFDIGWISSGSITLISLSDLNGKLDANVLNQSWVFLDFSFSYMTPYHNLKKIVTILIILNSNVFLIDFCTHSLLFCREICFVRFCLINLYCGIMLTLQTVDDGVQIVCKLIMSRIDKDG